MNYLSAFVKGAFDFLARKIKYSFIAGSAGAGFWHKSWMMTASLLFYTGYSIISIASLASHIQFSNKISLKHSKHTWQIRLKERKRAILKQKIQAIALWGNTGMKAVGAAWIWFLVFVSCCGFQSHDALCSSSQDAHALGRNQGCAAMEKVLSLAFTSTACLAGHSGFRHMAMSEFLGFERANRRTKEFLMEQHTPLPLLHVVHLCHLN